MAGTIILGSFNDSTVQFEADYDDNLDVLTFRCRNETDQSAFGQINKTADGVIVEAIQYGLEGLPNQITTIAIPQGGQGIRLSAGNKPGAWGGYSASLRYPF